MAQTLAHLGQRYRAPPAATFDERFGPYQSGPMTEQELLRRLYEQQMLQQPGAVVPGYQERFGDPTKVISQSLPPQPLANLGATTGGPTLSDISADPVLPGQQYAMEAKREPIPFGHRSGVTAGGGSAPAPAPAPTPPAPPAQQPGLRVAIKKRDNTVIEGKPGELHFDLGSRTSIRNDDRLGFVTPDGKYLTRKQALQWATEKEKLPVKTEGGSEFLHAIEYNASRRR